MAMTRASISDEAVRAARTVLPPSVRHWLWVRGHKLGQWPRPGQVDLGSLRRVTPISRISGYDRGQCIDRYYIERFLEARAADIAGRVLEVAEDTYTRAFGGDRVVRSDILNVEPGRGVTFVADLTRADHVPSDTFDAIVLTQTLHLIYDMPAVVRTLHRILKPGGVVLATMPGIARIARPDMDRWGDNWRLTTCSARRLFAAEFTDAGVEVASYGNVLSAIAFLHGLGAEELTPEELEFSDPDFQCLVTVRARKPTAAARGG
jgi:SAM-dependent methyltransferase